MDEATGAFNMGAGEFGDVARQIGEQLAAPGVLLFVVKADAMPMTASISSLLTLNMLMQMPNILRQTADMMEKRVLEIHAAPPPGTKLS